MPTTDRRVSASDYSSNSSSPFATDSFRTIGVLVDLHPSMPIIVSMLSTYASLLLMVTLSLYFCDVITQEQHRLAYLNVLHMFDFQRSCAKNLSSFSRFPTLSKSSTCTTTMRESFNVAPFFTKQPGSVSKRMDPKPSIFVSKWSCHLLGARVTIQVSFHLPHNSRIPNTQQAVWQKTVDPQQHAKTLQKCPPRPGPRPVPNPTNTSAILVAVTDSVAAKSEAGST